jgi:hypothetical protein
MKHDRDILIKNIHINNASDWQQTILAQLQPYKKIAPFYEETIGVVSKALQNQTDSIVELNKLCLEEVCDYLGINKSFDVFSEMNLNIAPANAPDEWALDTCIALGDVDEYWNPPGGREFFDSSKYEKAGVKLCFQKVQLRPYDQKSSMFEAGLSIIDVMMFNSVEEINAMLDEYEVEL